MVMKPGFHGASGKVFPEENNTEANSLFSVSGHCHFLV